MKNVIFVDDESYLLDGLRRMLYNYRGEWQMRFATSGAEALRSLALQPCDVIVTDMQMPGISGAELLAQVSQQYPDVIRIVLSGMCDRDKTLLSAVSAHQFLAKPCEAEVLKKTVDRALAMHCTLDNRTVKGFISRLKSLPSLPLTYMELVKAANDPYISTRQLGAIVSKDLAMTSKVLQLVNSPLFGLRRAVLNPDEACVYLGLDTIRALVLSLGVFSQYQRTGLFSVEELQRHSVRTAALAKQIACLERLPKREIDESFAAGMLHDVGKLVLAINYPEKYDGCIASASVRDVPVSEAESHTFGITHAEVGTYLLRLWGLPDTVTDAVGFHHRPSEANQKTLGPLAVVHIANFLTAEEECRPAAGVDMAYLTALGMSSNLTEWRSLVHHSGTKSSHLNEPNPLCT
jgi:HD-like signal output (HDOD) protein/CheY-like chemotaxis protein